MEVSSFHGRLIAVLSVDEAREALRLKFGDTDAAQIVGTLFESVFHNAAEAGQPCPDSVLINFRTTPKARPR